MNISKEELILRAKVAILKENIEDDLIVSASRVVVVNLEPLRLLKDEDDKTSVKTMYKYLDVTGKYPVIRSNALTSARVVLNTMLTDYINTMLAKYVGVLSIGDYSEDIASLSKHQKGSIFLDVLNLSTVISPVIPDSIEDYDAIEVGGLGFTYEYIIVTGDYDDLFSFDNPNTVKELPPTHELTMFINDLDNKDNVDSLVYYKDELYMVTDNIYGSKSLSYYNV